MKKIFRNDDLVLCLVAVDYLWGNRHRYKVWKETNKQILWDQLYSCISSYIRLLSHISYCHTRPYLGGSAQLKIWQVSACKIGPRSGIIIKLIHPTPPTPPPTHPGQLDWKVGISQQPLLGSFPNLTLRLRRPSQMLGKLKIKTTSNGRRPQMEDDLETEK
jgi:hypothetical protein